jgi:serine/threonine-protein kinase
VSDRPVPRDARCLDDEQLLLLLEGKLTGAARERADEHLDGCAACRRLVGAAAPTQDPRTTGGDGAEGVLGRGTSIGRYLVLSLLGQGGMGVVYAAYDAELDRRVALKLLRTARGSEGARRLLVREARALGKLSHPNVVQVYDVGERDGDVFVAMELVEGRALDQWCQGAPRPSSAEVLAAYLDAARGLSAAHEKGLVHRDVKPSNILRGDDGRVRVADFGLAAGRDAEAPPGQASRSGPRAAPAEDAILLDETIPARSGPEGSLGEGLTNPDAVVGTPLYMAPEQQQGLRATAASDQYSLCVALHEGLYGAAPFRLRETAGPAATLAGLLAQKLAGPPAAPPAGSSVPPWVYRALARGLAPDPAARYPSMDALIAALSADPEAPRRGRRRRAGVAVTAAALLALAAVGWARSGAFRDPCAHPEQHLAGVWDQGVKGRVRAAFLGTGRPYAEGTVTRVTALLDGYGASYATMRGEVCRSPRSGRQRVEIADLREACLERRRGQLHALTTLLAERPDPEVLDRAVQAAAGLPPVTYCADTEALTARVRPPEDPGRRAQVAALQVRVDRVEALLKAGKYQEGVPLGEPLLAEAASIGYAPLRAQVQLLQGRLRDGTGDSEGARALLREAAISAAEGRDDVLAANAWAHLLFVVGDRQRRFDEAAAIRALGPTALARVDDEGALAMWANVEGTVLLRAGKYAEARVAYERALALRERALGPDHPDTAATLHNLATLMCAADDCPAARVAMERAVAISERSLGPDHPETALSLGNLGNVLRRVGDYPGAVAVHERALAIKERALGPEHRSVASSLNNLGSALSDLGELARAVAVLERALAIKERALGPDHPDVASTLTVLGRARVRAGQLEAARPLLERSRALREKAEGSAHPNLAEPLLGLGELALARRAPEEAAPLLERALLLDSAECARDVELALAEALWQLGQDRPRARALAARAQAAYERLHHRPGLERATRWLAAHPAAA